MTDRTALAMRLHSAAIHLLRRLRVADKESGVGAARLSALSVLVFGGPCTLGELAEAEQVKPPTMTRVVQGLEADGLATRTASKVDRRSAVVRATAKGRALLDAARKRRIDRFVDALKEADEAELRALQSAVAVLEQLLTRTT